MHGLHALAQLDWRDRRIARLGMFVSPLAGWQYDGSGRLARATKLKGIKDFSARSQGLPPLPVEQWAHHFTFMQARPMPASSAEASPSVAEYIGAPLYMQCCSIRFLLALQSRSSCAAA